MRLCTTTHQRVPDLCLIHIISGVGTEPNIDDQLYLVTISGGYRIHRRYGCNRKVNGLIFFTRATMWLSSIASEHTRISPLISAPMDFWSRCPGHNVVSFVVLDLTPSTSGPGQSQQSGRAVVTVLQPRPRTVRSPLFASWLS